MSRQNIYDDNIYENSPLEFETLLNNMNEWENNPIEASRHCFKHLYNIIRFQHKKIEIIDKEKASINDLISGLNTKANIADLMLTLNEINQNIEKCPTFNQTQFNLQDKISKNEIKELLKNKPSLEEIKSFINNGEIKINIKNIMEDLNRNFISFKNFSDMLSTKANKDNLINILNKKADKSDIDMIKNDIINLMELNKKVKDIENNIDKMSNNINQKFDSINNDLIKIKNDKKEYIDVSNQLNNFESKLNNNSSLINNTISELEQKLNLVLSDFESLDKNMKINEQNYELMNGEQNNKNNKISIEIENFENKINSIYKEINKMYNLLENKMNNYEIESINLKIEELDKKSSFFLNQKYITSQEIDNIYNSICDDIQQKFINMEKYTKDIMKKFDNYIAESLDGKVENKEIKSIQMDINQLKCLLDKKADLNMMNKIEDIMTKLNQNYININEYEHFLEMCSKDIKEVKNDLILKSNIDETMSYLKDKANINDVNIALNQIHDELDIKLSFQDFDHAMNNQNKINTALIQNNQIGIWMWESGIIKNSHNVPWEIQKVNNSPENLIWNNNTNIIVVKKKGIYMINLAFFVKKNAFIQLYINGEMILSKNKNEFENEFNHNKNKIYENNLINCSIEESIAGLNVNELLFLQEKSKITVSYDGNSDVKGIMLLKMLC